MRRLVYLRAARNDLADILEYITRESGSLDVGDRFVGLIREKCRHLACLSSTIGRSRPELGVDLRSHPQGYVIFFRYLGDVFEVVNVLHASRDIDSHFNPEH